MNPPLPIASLAGGHSTRTGKRLGLLCAVLLLGKMACLATVVAPPTPATIVVTPKVQFFTTADVQLLEGPFKASEDAAAQYLLSLELDRLIAPYRLSVGLPAKAPQYLGWETKNLPGVALAFYLSGVSRLLAATGRSEFRERLDYVLRELTLCQDAGHGYLLGTKNGPDILAKVVRAAESDWKGFPNSGWGTGSATPFYAMEKLLSGLRDTYRQTGQRIALDIEIRLADWLEKFMSHLSDAQMQDIMVVEFGGMNWVLADLYADTGNPRYLAMAKRWQHQWVLTALAKGTDELAGKHANAQFPKISGLVAQYPYTGDPLELKTAQYFWDRVVKHHSYATGGNSESEYYDPPDELSDKLTPYTEENCNTYNMLRLTALLASIEPRPEYAEFIERALYNHILAAQDPADGRVCYFLPLLPGSAKIFEPLLDGFTCCTCSGMDSYVRHREYIYAHGADDLYVNLFVASELHWRQKKVRIRQETKFPEQDTSVLRIDSEQPVVFTLNLRYPAWALQGMVVRINGQEQPLTGPVGTFCRFTREWRKGDVVEVKVPLTLHVEKMPDDPGWVALFAGPVLLAGVIPPNNGWTSAEDNTTAVLVPDLRPLSEWVTPTAEPLTFRSAISRPSPVLLKPFYRVGQEHYTVYWDQLAEVSWQDRIQRQSAREKAAQERDLLTLDRVIVGDLKSESDHRYAGKSISRYRPGQGPESPGDELDGNLVAYHHRMTSILPQQNFRYAVNPNSFSYQVRLTPDTPTDLVCTFFGRTCYPRPNKLSYVIKIDGSVLVEEQTVLSHTFTTGLFERIIPLPASLVAGKSSVTVTLEARPGGKTPSLTEMRILRRR
jgi:uncharacterized protein